MRRKPSASHCVKKPPPEVYRPDSWVFFSGAQVLRISSVKRLGLRQVVDHQHGRLRGGTTRTAPLTSTRVRFSSSPCRRSGCGGTAALRSSCIRLMTIVLAGSRSKVRSTVRIQNAGLRSRAADEGRAFTHGVSIATSRSRTSRDQHSLPTSPWHEGGCRERAACGCLRAGSTSRPSRS